MLRHKATENGLYVQAEVNYLGQPHHENMVKLIGYCTNVPIEDACSILDCLLEMTLEEYEKVLEERKKAFQALKTKERKVDTKEFESMQALSSKKVNHDIFIKLECMLNPKG
ncbi:RGG repeats nuclear RNA binding protein B [Glycine soja]